MTVSSNDEETVLVSGLTVSNSDHDLSLVVKGTVKVVFEGFEVVLVSLLEVDKRTVWGLSRYIHRVYI